LDAAEILVKDPLAKVRTALLARLPVAGANDAQSSDRIEALALALASDKELAAKKAEVELGGLTEDEEKALRLVAALREQQIAGKDFTDSERIHAIELALAGDEDMAVRKALAARGDLTAETENTLLAKEFTRQMLDDIIRHTSQQDLLILFSGTGNTAALLKDGRVSYTRIAAEPDSVYTDTIQAPQFIQLLLKSATLDGDDVQKVRLAEAMLQFYGSPVLFTDGGLNLKWTHLGADNTSLFLKDESFRAAIRRI
jgi:hypothetical protein